VLPAPTSSQAEAVPPRTFCLDPTADPIPHQF
jgi:hypothetical protein